MFLAFVGHSSTGPSTVLLSLVQCNLKGQVPSLKHLNSSIKALKAELTKSKVLISEVIGNDKTMNARK